VNYRSHNPALFQKPLIQSACIPKTFNLLSLFTVVIIVKIKIVKPSEIDLSEKEIQEAFETNLEILEEGLQKIGSFVPIGTGVIDTLAIDEENNPVLIEFKKLGNFDRDALI